MEQQPSPHLSVLLDETVAIFNETKMATYVDGTLGAGGHAAAILEAHPEIKRFIGIDQDPDALAIAEEKLSPWREKVTLVRGNFVDLEHHLDQLGIATIDGLLLDIGVSSMQFDRPEKGFSFSKDGPLDMRMDPEGDLSAYDIINGWSEKDLGRVFRDYGEERKWRRAAHAVVKARDEQTIETTRQLVAVLAPALGRGKPGIHPVTLIFQALRIAVNRELERLQAVVPRAIQRLNTSGRMAVISFHSLEDRIVKQAFRYAADDKVDTSGIAGMFLPKDREVKQVTRKPIVASSEEVARNPRSRSAKLRAVERL